MTDQLLDVLKIGFLALLYLFFMRVLWVVSSEVRASRSGATAQAASAAAAQATHIAAHPVAEPVPVANVPLPNVPPPGAPPLQKRKAPKGRRGTVGRLVVIEPRARRGSSYAVGPEITIGRSPGCTVQITDDAFVSGVHARVYVADAYLLVEDLGSTNGTYLNGERLHQPRPLGKGDRVQVGKTVLEAQ